VDSAEKKGRASVSAAREKKDFVGGGRALGTQSEIGWSIITGEKNGAFSSPEKGKKDAVRHPGGGREDLVVGIGILFYH